MYQIHVQTNLPSTLTFGMTPFFRTLLACGRGRSMCQKTGHNLGRHLLIRAKTLHTERVQLPRLANAIQQLRFVGARVRKRVLLRVDG